MTPPAEHDRRLAYEENRRRIRLRFRRPDSEQQLLKTLSVVQSFSTAASLLIEQVCADSLAARQQTPEHATAVREVRNIAAMMVEELDETLSKLGG